MNKKIESKRHLAALMLFKSKYIPSISTEFLNEYGRSYQTFETVKNNWRRDNMYSAVAEEFLIFKSKMFLRCLDSRDSNSTNPQFLRRLAYLMADYLAAYTHRKPGCPSRPVAYKELKKKLYDENPYIQKMLQQQAEKKQARAECRKQKRTAQAKHAQAEYIDNVAVYNTAVATTIRPRRKR